MKKLILSLLLITATGQAANLCTQANETDCISAQQISALLQEKKVQFSEGAYKGQFVDQSLKRPATLVKELETEESYVVSNFSSQGQFWLAKVPKAAVKDIVFQVALFKGPITLTLAHFQFRFIMSEAIQLVRSENGHIITAQTKDVVFTIQAALPKGKSYEAKDAFIGNYKLVGRLVNTYERVKLEEVDDGDIVTQYMMKNVDSRIKNEIMRNAVEYSSETQLDKNYSGTKENCISITFDIIDKTLNLNYPRVTLNFANFFLSGKSPNEKMVLEQLEKRQLIDSNSRVTNY